MPPVELCFSDDRVLNYARTQKLYSDKIDCSDICMTSACVRIDVVQHLKTYCNSNKLSSSQL
jgi:hypothetical protein